MTTADTEEQRLPSGESGRNRVLRHLAIVGMRGCSTVSKFLLAIYTARYLGLADLTTMIGEWEATTKDVGFSK